jgi:thioesterase domain-containing protein/acyl carrier protein
MMPAVVARVDAMPLTPNGKIDRNALALPAPVAIIPTATAPDADLTETALLRIWEDVLDRRPIAPDDDFFDLGGHSLLGARLLARVERAFGIRLTAASLFEAPTVGRMAALLRGGQPVWGPSRVFALRSAGTRTPLYFLHPPPLFNPLFTLLPADQPAFAVSTFDSKSLRLPLRLDHIAARQAAAIRQFQPEGPIILAGWCAEGTLAYEVARQLTAAGSSVPLVVMIDTFHPRSGVTGGPTPLVRNLRRARNLMRVPGAEARARIAWWTRGLRSRAQYRYRLAVEDGGTFGGDPPEALQLAIAVYDPPPYSGRVLLVRAERPQGEVGVDASRGWRETASNLVVRDVPGSHAGLFTAPYVEALATVLREELERLPGKLARAADGAG